MSEPPPNFGNYQFEIYMPGLIGELPAHPTSYELLEEAAREVLSLEAFGYVAGGAGEELTMRANRQGFERWRIVPRMLIEATQRDLRTTVLGTHMPAPRASSASR